ncbi:MAG: YdcF family protein [Cellulosilyticaceae bacterium]
MIIVPGYPAKKDGNMSPILRERIKKAAELYHEGIAEVIICSGAAVANNYTEADVMAQALNKLGVAEEYIIREKFAENTYGNLMLSSKIMQNKQLKTAVIVSSPWHLRKASSYALRLGIDHTVEKSKYPYEYMLGIGVIYLYTYTQMLIMHWRYK